jgi:hypothetical protein
MIEIDGLTRRFGAVTAVDGPRQPGTGAGGRRCGRAALWPHLKHDDQGLSGGPAAAHAARAAAAAIARSSGAAGAGDAAGAAGAR